MKNLKYLMFALLGISFVSCEDVIELDLKDAEQQIIIEASLQTDTKVCEVDMTKSRTFYEDNTFETINQASVELLSPDGAIVILTEETPGHYVAQDIETVPGEIYQLNITTVEGASFSANTRAPFPVLIDSVVIEEFPFPEDENDPSYIVACTATDPTGQDNFYRLKMLVNGEYDPYRYILRDDEITNNDEIRLGAFEELFSGDTVNLEFISMDESSYKYFDNISKISQGGSNTVPFNPVGNFGEDALGVFGIYTSDYRTVVIP